MFEIHIDTSAAQLGDVISQRGNPISFSSIKINLDQRDYTVTEREVLSMVETLK